MGQPKTGQTNKTAGQDTCPTGKVVSVLWTNGTDGTTLSREQAYRDRINGWHEKRRAERDARLLRLTQEERARWSAQQLMRRYGLTGEDYEAMVAAQGGRCAICREPPPPGCRLQVDHDHATGRVRALLCPRCNTLTGWIESNPDRVEPVQRYLAAHKEVLHID